LKKSVFGSDAIRRQKKKKSRTSDLEDDPESDMGDESNKKNYIPRTIYGEMEGTPCNVDQFEEIISTHLTKATSELDEIDDHAYLMEKDATFATRVGAQRVPIPTKLKRLTTKTELFNYTFNKRVYNKQLEIAIEENNLIIPRDLMSLLRTAVCIPNPMRGARTTKKAKLTTALSPEMKINDYFDKMTKIQTTSTKIGKIKQHIKYESLVQHAFNAIEKDRG